MLMIVMMLVKVIVVMLLMMMLVMLVKGLVIDLVMLVMMVTVMLVIAVRTLVMVEAGRTGDASGVVGYGAHDGDARNDASESLRSNRKHRVSGRWSS